MSFRTNVGSALLLIIVTVCVFSVALDRESFFFREFEIILIQGQWGLLTCFAIWLGMLIFAKFSLKDPPLIFLLLFALRGLFVSRAAGLGLPTHGVLILVFGATLGKSVFFFLRDDDKRGRLKSEVPRAAVGKFLLGLILVLAFAALWHSGVSNGYDGPRWTGPCGNPNEYGMLMSVGIILAIGLLVIISKLNWFLFVAMGIMTVSVLCSGSRGAVLGTVVGLLYLTNCHRKFKWRYVLLGLFVIVGGVCFFWNTSNALPWYVERLDMERGSVQHRLAAWVAGFEIMRDHPFGVGWDMAEEVYEESYSPPVNGGAIRTNDYIMLGVQLGWPGLICFIVYSALGLKKIKSREIKPEKDQSEFKTHNSKLKIETACRAAVLAMLLEFWFDGGLFKIATASLFWILLELGSAYRYEEVLPSLPS
jgi:hypothetical protein